MLTSSCHFDVQKRGLQPVEKIDYNESVRVGEPPDWRKDYDLHYMLISNNDTVGEPPDWRKDYDLPRKISHVFSLGRRASRLEEGLRHHFG